ncbi:MAG: DUF4190 domain-containing protein [Bifidobacteriaceae bacterium]|nr:DUF4190 domain-containing protein [Bifidobacteriaceae bacterium]
MSDQSPYGPAESPAAGPTTSAGPYAAQPFGGPPDRYPPYAGQPGPSYGPPQPQYGTVAPYGGYAPTAPYGPPAYAPYLAVTPPQATAKNGWGVASLILSIAGVTVIFSLFIGSILGIIFGHLGLHAVRQGTANNRGVTLAGLIVGYVGLGLSIIFWVVIIGLLGMSSWYYDYGYISALAAYPVM